MAENSNKKRYCFDSSTFINSWRRYYPPKIFPVMWESLSKVIEDKRLIVPKEAEKELKVGNDELWDWFKKNNDCVSDYSNDQLKIVSEIVNKYPNVSQYNKTRPYHADPFVVALAKIEKCTVVSWEGLNGSIKNPSIPELCREHGVEHCNLVDLCEHEGWLFKTLN